MESSDHTGTPTALLNRRDFFKRAALLGAAVGASGLALSACTTAHGAGKDGASSETIGKEPAAPAQTGEVKGEASIKKDAAQLDCTDTTGLSSAEIKVRESLEYVDKTPKPEQDCANCQHWKEPPSDGACGGCVVMPGPVHPKGWCNIWVATR